MTTAVEYANNLKLDLKGKLIYLSLRHLSEGWVASIHGMRLYDDDGRGYDYLALNLRDGGNIFLPVAWITDVRIRDNGRVEISATINNTLPLPVDR